MKNTIRSFMLLVIITGTVFVGCAQKEGGPVVETPIVETEASDDQVSVKVFVDGIYETTGSYQSPAGTESIVVTLTVEDDVVSTLEVQPQAVNPKSVNFQGLFTKGINELVVGKKLDEIEPFTQVNGSSLTPKGFAMALEDIKMQAMAEAGPAA